MTKNPVLATTLSVMFLILSVLAMILPGVLGKIVGMFLLPLLFVLLAGILVGSALPAAIGIIAPIVAFFIVGEGNFLSDALPVSLGLMAAGIMSGIIYGRYGTAIGSVIAGVLFAALVYGLAKMLFMLMLGESYKTIDYLGEFFPEKIPGLVLIFLGAPLLVWLLRKAGITKVLRDEEISK